MTVSIAPTYAEQEACPDCVGDGILSSKELLLEELPISVWTDSSIYDHDSTIRVEGRVANVRAGAQVALLVKGPFKQNIVTVDQLEVDSLGRFSTTLSTVGNNWKYDGAYIIRVQYANDVYNNVIVELTGGIMTTKPSVTCSMDELSISGACVPFSISGAKVISARANSIDNSLVISISSSEPGTLTMNPSSDVIRGIFMVIVDGEEWDDVEITGNDVTVMFPAGAEEIEIIGTFVIPEFGTIATMILSVAIISIIAVTAKTKLNRIPKF
jgi:predicted secreted protein with PEFG-CTERM motif